jgi:putative flippase GtrA
VAIKNKSEKLRFGAVGVVNTLIDIGVLFTLKSLGLPVVSANIISTTVAFCFSFFANKKYTFKTTGTNVKREIILFVMVTLFGLWVLQNLVIVAATALLAGSGLSDSVILFVAKILAICVSLVWNYSLYSRVVFKRKGI